MNRDSYSNSTRMEFNEEAAGGFDSHISDYRRNSNSFSTYSSTGNDPGYEQEPERTSPSYGIAGNR